MFFQETIFAHFERVHIFALALAGIALFNLLTLRKPNRNIVALEKPSVSILIPARNEEHTITKCLQSLLAQDYPHFEVLVWDDCSTDKTRDILRTIHDKRFRWIAGTEPPPGWLGKSWACFNLAQYARGDLLIFTDADTWHEPSMVQTLVNEMLVHKLDALSGVAREETKTLGEKLTVPFLVWSVVALYPHFLSLLFPRWRAFAVGNGQIMVFYKGVYWAIDGHQAVRGKVVEDIELARILRLRGYRYRFYNLTEIVSCQMYRGFQEAFRGLAKSYFWVFGGNVAFSSFVWGWLFFYTIYPYWLLFGKHELVRALLTIGANGFSWWVASSFYRLSPWSIFLNPLITVINTFIGWTSIFLTKTRRVLWKERHIFRTFSPSR